jgi:hypothetical protein
MKKRNKGNLTGKQVQRRVASTARRKRRQEKLLTLVKSKLKGYLKVIDNLRNSLQEMEQARDRQKAGLEESTNEART